MGKWVAVFDYLQVRLAEPSTHASVAALLGFAGLSLDTGPVHDFLAGAGVVFGCAGIFLGESK